MIMTKKIPLIDTYKPKKGKIFFTSLKLSDLYYKRNNEKLTK
jgi:hypothetical protein